jgi:hypothetical protein
VQIPIDRLLFPEPVTAGLNLLVLCSLIYMMRSTNEDPDPITVTGGSRMDGTAPSPQWQPAAKSSQRRPESAPGGHPRFSPQEGTAMNLPPAKLDPSGANLWVKIDAKYDLRPDELSLLEASCRETDLISRLQRVLDEADDLMVKGSTGQMVVHPAVAEIRQHRATLATLWRALKLPDENGQGQTNQQRDAGNASWASRRGA